ncbi:MAG: hypothetical protein IKG69_00550 [Atopobiaceae bacterium]|nr:hypothetical protein [Atopobiaceae bacterium]
MTHDERTCETCDECVYVGEGDFVCIRDDVPVFVIEDWQHVREACEGWVEA